MLFGSNKNILATSRLPIQADGVRFHIVSLSRIKVAGGEEHWA